MAAFGTNCVLWHLSQEISTNGTPFCPTFYDLSESKLNVQIARQLVIWEDANSNRTKLGLPQCSLSNSFTFKLTRPQLLMFEICIT